MGSLSRLLKQEIGLASPGTVDRNGQRAPGAMTYYQGRVVDRTKMYRDKEGREVVSERQAFIFADVEDLTPEWHVQLPSGYTPQTPPIIKAIRVSTKRGFHHMEIVV